MPSISMIGIKMSKKFQIVVADPPFRFADRLEMSDVPRGAAANYATMSNADIAALPISELADPDGCLLALWVPSSLLAEGLHIMKAWQFEQKQTFIWCKNKKQPLNELEKLVKSIKDISAEQSIKSFKKALFQVMDGFPIKNILGFGLGHLFRQTHELCLIGINNTQIYKRLENKSQRSVCFAENAGHSTKPEALQDSLELMFGNCPGKLELFARRERPGWVCIGNECPATKGEDIRVSLSKLV
jgi:N6-adenosine-specific RNA methylase IME4